MAKDVVLLLAKLHPALVIVDFAIILVAVGFLIGATKALWEDDGRIVPILLGVILGVIVFGILGLLPLMPGGLMTTALVLTAAGLGLVESERTIRRPWSWIGAVACLFAFANTFLFALSTVTVALASR